MLRNIITPANLLRGTAVLRNNSSIIAVKSRSLFANIKTKARSDRVAIPLVTQCLISASTNKQIFSSPIFNKFQRRTFATDPATETKAAEAPVEIQVQKAPTPAKVLTYAGLLPFLAGAIGPFFLPIDLASQAVFYQMTYGASILSFVGAVHWGLAINNYPRQLANGTVANGWGQYLFSVVPSLLAWGGLTLAPFNGA
jgi:hypothetical protein